MSIAERTTHRWTVDELYRVAETGVFNHQRLELIDGELVEMLPLGYPHVVAVAKSESVLRDVFGKSYWVRTQVPLRLNDLNEPMPDVNVVKGRITDYTNHPTSALLVVEISSGTLRADLGEMASLYASAGILDYWVIDLRKRCLYVLRDPVRSRKHKFGFFYDMVEQLDRSKRVSPLARAKSKITVADLLP